MSGAPHANRGAQERAALSACIVRCSAARDDRGRWRAEDRCADALQRQGCAPLLADHCAAAARRVGAWLATVRL